MSGLGVVLGWVPDYGFLAVLVLILAWKADKIIDSCGRFWKIILKDRRDRERIPAKVKAKKASTAQKIESKTKAKRKAG